MNFATAAPEATILSNIRSTLTSNLDFYSKPNYESNEKVEKKKIRSDKRIFKKLQKVPLLGKLLEDTLFRKE